MSEGLIGVSDEEINSVNKKGRTNSKERRTITHNERQSEDNNEIFNYFN